VLELWGNTPIAEPKFFEATKTAKPGELSVIAVRDLDVDAFNAFDVGILTERVHKKITNKIDDDGMYKTTPSMDSMKLPRTSQINTMKQIASNNQDDKAIEKELYKAIGLKKTDLTEWEQELVDEIFFAYVEAVDANIIGNVSDKTPFARYLKN
jgi:hypothetical protein